MDCFACNRAFHDPAVIEVQSLRAFCAQPALCLDCTYVTNMAVLAEAEVWTECAAAFFVGPELQIVGVRGRREQREQRLI